MSQHQTQHLALNGFAGWRSFQFTDLQDEAEFREKDFEITQMLYLETNLMQFALVIGACLVYDLPNTPLGRTNAVELIPYLVAVLVMQNAIRFRVFPKQPHLIGWFFVLTTLAEWFGFYIADQRLGFNLLQSDTMFIVLFFCCCICQGILIFHAWCYYIELLLFSVVFSPSVVAAFLYVSTPDPSKPMLMTKLEFWFIFCVAVFFSGGFIFSQLHTRRMHHMEQMKMAELLRCEKERLVYDIAFAQQRRSRSAVTVKLSRDDDDDDDTAARGSKSGGAEEQVE